MRSFITFFFSIGECGFITFFFSSLELFLPPQ